ncbi:MAG: hypothetical protein NT062_19245 [Proteobacteria bacterium]|nr:hypothetical protein [Pseudomonadota bacterium]
MADDGDPKPPGHLSLARVLGEGVHGDPRVAYRELVDRAHEACALRLANDPACVPSILVSTQTIGGLAHVSVTDNGEAFEADAFRALYQVIQAGRLGAVKRKLASAGAAGAHDVVGRFGSALLAAFMLANRVVITARRHDTPPDAALRFTCDSRTYQLEPTTSARPGTIVQLRIRATMQQVATVEVIRKALAAHALAIPFPVRIGADPVPINPR